MRGNRSPPDSLWFTGSVWRTACTVHGLICRCWHSFQTCSNAKMGKNVSDRVSESTQSFGLICHHAIYDRLHWAAVYKPGNHIFFITIKQNWHRQLQFRTEKKKWFPAVRLAGASVLSAIGQYFILERPTSETPCVRCASLLFGVASVSTFSNSGHMKQVKTQCANKHDHEAGEVIKTCSSKVHDANLRGSWTALHTIWEAATAWQF